MAGTGDRTAEVVDSHPYYRQRCALEAWHIRTEHQTMNRDEGPLYHQSITLDSPTETSCSLTTLLLQLASDILYM